MGALRLAGMTADYVASCRIIRPIHVENRCSRVVNEAEVGYPGDDPHSAKIFDPWHQWRCLFQNIIVWAFSEGC